MIAFLALLFCGFGAKFTDFITEKKSKIDVGIPITIGFAYGMAGGFSIIALPEVAPVVFGIIAGVLVTLKVDHIAHAAGVLGFAIVLAISGIPEFSLGLALLFAMVSAIDELGNEMADNKKIKGRLRKFFRHRLLLEITVLYVAIATLQWQLFAAILVFDIGYFMAEKLATIKGKAILASA